MTKTEFLLEYVDKANDLVNNQEYKKGIVNDLLDVGFAYMNFDRENNKNRDSNLLFQIALCKGNSILQMTNGMDFNSINADIRGLVDIQSLSSIYRSLFENYCFFNHLYIREWREEEFLLINNLWKISSLRQRNNMLKETILLKEKKYADKATFEIDYANKLEKEIQHLNLYSTNKERIEEFIKYNQWQLTVENGKVKKISWKEMHKKATINKNRNENSYRALSLDAHPSYFAVIQFGELYKEGNDDRRVNLLLYETMELLGNYIYDFEKLISNYKGIVVKSRGFHFMNFFGNPNYMEYP